jgi:hypothetical protein
VASWEAVGEIQVKMMTLMVLRSIQTLGSYRKLKPQGFPDGLVCGVRRRE